MSSQRRGQVAALLIAVGFVLTMTLFSPPESLQEIHDPVSDHVGLRPVEMLLNVALFVPLGAVVGWFGRPRWLLGVVALSISIEIVQLWLPERQTEAVDVLTNSVGGALGFLAVHLGRRRLRERRLDPPRPDRSER